MCGRFSLGADATALAAQFDLFESPAWPPRYNIAPTQEVLVVVQDPATATRQAQRHRWGLIPSWAKDPAIGNQLINAQAETAALKPAFPVAFRKRRCLILADGFYEWRKEGRSKQPFHIRLRDGRPFPFAGLWEHWEGPEGTCQSREFAYSNIREQQLRRSHQLGDERHVSVETVGLLLCGKSASEVSQLVAGPSVFIYDACVALVGRIMKGEEPQPPDAKPTRRRLLDRLSDGTLYLSFPFSSGGKLLKSAGTARPSWRAGNSRCILGGAHPSVTCRSWPRPVRWAGW